MIIRSYHTLIEPDEILVSITIPKPNDENYYTSYYQLGRRNAVNITRMSICAMISFDDSGLINKCRIVDGSLFSKPQQIIEVENFLLGKKLNETTIEQAVEPLAEKIESEIGNRWSAPYKKPVFINIFKDALKDIMNQKTAN